VLNPMAVALIPRYFRKSRRAIPISTPPLIVVCA
jgi:hypothetical protein